MLTYIFLIITYSTLSIEEINKETDQRENTLDQFYSLIPKNNLQNQENNKNQLQLKSQNITEFRFRSIFNYLNDAPYTSLQECPTASTTKLQLVQEFMKPQVSPFLQPKTSKIILFYGYSTQLMISTVQAIALDLKQNIQTLDILKEEIKVQDKKTNVLAIYNIEHYKEKENFQNQLNNLHVKIILICGKAYECGLEWVEEGIFFDFPELKQIKIMFANEILKVESQFRNMEFSDNLIDEKNKENDSQEEDGDEERDGDRERRKFRFQAKNPAIQNQLKNDQTLIDQIIQKTSFLQITSEIKKSQGRYDDDEEGDEEDGDEKEDDNQPDLDNIDGVHKKYLSDQSKKRSKRIESCTKLIKKYKSGSYKEHFSIIQKNDFQIVLQRQPGQVPNIQNVIIADDDIKIIAGKNTCLVFDQEFDSYLNDRALPIVSRALDNEQHHFERSGFIEEDIKNIMRITINMQFQKNQQIIQAAQNMLMKEKIDKQVLQYILSDTELRQGINNYNQLTPLKQANRIYAWGQNYELGKKKIVGNQNHQQNQVSTNANQFQIDKQISQVNQDLNLNNINQDQQSYQKILQLVGDKISEHPEVQQIINKINIIPENKKPEYQKKVTQILLQLYPEIQQQMSQPHQNSNIPTQNTQLNQSQNQNNQGFLNKTVLAIRQLQQNIINQNQKFLQQLKQDQDQFLQNLKIDAQNQINQLIQEIKSQSLPQQQNNENISQTSLRQQNNDIQDQIDSSINNLNQDIQKEIQSTQNDQVIIDSTVNIDQNYNEDKVLGQQDFQPDLLSK